jgi:pimeloyl-ACP methyl ester carboxylesterase
VERALLPSGSTISYIKLGSGPQLLLLAGLFQDLNGLKYLIRRLSKRFTVYCLAMPGGDGSSPLKRYNLETVSQWLDEAVDTLGVQKVVLVSVSLGVAMAALLLRGSRLQVTEFFAQEPVTRVGDTSIGWAALYYVTRAFRRCKLEWAVIPGLWLFRVFLADVLHLKWARGLKSASLKGLARVGDLIAHYPISDMAIQAGRRAPTISVMGSKATRMLVRRTPILRIAGAMQSVREIILEGSGHLLPGRHQQQLAEQIIQLTVEKQEVSAKE